MASAVDRYLYGLHVTVLFLMCTPPESWGSLHHGDPWLFCPASFSVAVTLRQGEGSPVDGAPGLGLPALCKVLEAAELEPVEQVSCSEPTLRSRHSYVEHSLRPHQLCCHSALQSSQPPAERDTGRTLIDMISLFQD